MGRPRKGARVLGPYACRGGWQLVLVGEDGERVDRYVESEEEAWRAKAAAERQLTDAANVSVTDVLDDYERYMRNEKQNKEDSVKQTSRKLRQFFPDDLLLCSLSAQRAQALYDAYRTRKRPNGKPIAVDHHRNVLAEARTFARWCVKKKLLKSNPFDGVEGIGRRRKGKLQHTRDESKKFLSTSKAEADKGSEMAIAAMVALLMGDRASEILNRLVRELDDGGRLLIVNNTKTRAGERTLEVPELLRPYLMKLAEGKQPVDRLFRVRTVRWLNTCVKKICRLAGVPEICTHALRGTHATLATEHGVTGHEVAAALGHESVTTTYGNYTNPSAIANARTRRVAHAIGLHNETASNVVQEDLGN